jgi:hypothetical protein
MFKNKKANSESKKKNVVINMVLVVTIRNQVSEVDAFNEKEMKRNKIVANWQEEEQIQKSFEDVIGQLQKEEPPLQLPTLEIVEGLLITTNKC